MLPWRCRVCPGAMPVIQPTIYERAVLVRVLPPVLVRPAPAAVRCLIYGSIFESTNSGEPAWPRRQWAVWRADNGLQTAGMAVQGKQARRIPASRVRAVPSGETVRSIVRRAGTWGYAPVGSGTMFGL